MKQDWYKSKLLWVSVLSLLGIVIVNVFNVFDNDVWTTIVNSVLSILSVVGIINNPTNSNGWGNVEEEDCEVEENDSV